MRRSWLMFVGGMACGTPSSDPDADPDTDPVADTDTDLVSPEIAACRSGAQVFELVDGELRVVSATDGDPRGDPAVDTDAPDEGFVPDPNERLYALMPGSYRFCPGEQRLKLRTATGDGTLQLSSLDPADPAMLRSTGPLEVRAERVEVTDLEVFGGAGRFVGLRIDADVAALTRVSFRELSLAGRFDVVEQLRLDDVVLAEVTEGPRLRAAVTSGPVPEALVTGMSIQAHRGGVMLSWDGVDLSLTGLRVEGGTSRGISDATTTSAAQRGSIHVEDAEVIDHEAMSLFAPATSLRDVRVRGGRFDQVVSVEPQYPSIGPPGALVPLWSLEGLDVRDAVIGGAVIRLSVGVYVDARGWHLQDLDLGVRGNGVHVESENARFTCTNCVFDGLRRNEISAVRAGALHVERLGEAVLEDAVFRHNQAAVGPAIYLEQGSLSLTNTRFEANQASGDAGAMFVGPRHRGLSFSGEVRFEGNEAGGNGGAFVIDGQQLEYLNSPAIRGVDFVGNRAGGEGGAFWSSQDVGVRFRDCTFRGNEAAIGGAVRARPLLSATDCVFEDNTATSHAGAFSTAYPANTSVPPVPEDFPTLTRCTFHGNTAPLAGIGESRRLGGTAGGRVSYTATDFGSGSTANVISTLRLGEVSKQISGVRTGDCQHTTAGSCP